MANHYSTIGLPIHSEGSYEEYRRLALGQADQSRTEHVADGMYRPWALGGGAELWCVVDGAGAFAGVVPYFQSESRVQVRLDRRVTRPEGTVLDGGFLAWRDDSSGTGFPFVFDVPDFRRFDELPLGKVVDITWTAFAHDLTPFADEPAFRASRTPMAVESFIPSGLFLPKGGPIEPPQAKALFSGWIEAAERRTNAVTGLPYWWLGVLTLSGTIDVVADPTIVNGVPAVGTIAQVDGWITARPVDSHRAPTNTKARGQQGRTGESSLTTPDDLAKAAPVENESATARTVVGRHGRSVSAIRCQVAP